jgi:MYXO-CTERM domain-containing protein
MLLRDADGAVRFGPVGESASGGVSSRETGALRQTPTEAMRRWDADYGGTDRSTFGLPNRWSDGEQDLSALRGQSGAARDVDEAAADTPVDRPDDGSDECGCSAAAANNPPGRRAMIALGGVALSLAWMTRRRRA